MKSKIKWIILGALGAVLVQLLVAWKPAHFIGQRSFSSTALACSSDGKIVYAADLEFIYKSEDGGKNWSPVKQGTRIKKANVH